MRNEKVRVVVAHEYSLMRGMLAERLKREPWIDVCGVASGVDDVRALVELQMPQILVMNVSLKGGAGVASLQQLKRDYCGLSIVALSSDPELENAYMGAALRAWADDCVDPEDSIGDLVDAIRSAQKKTLSLSEKHRLGQMPQEHLLLPLSKREAEVFCLTGCGYVTQRIANKMNVSRKTVESFRERIRAKLGFRTGADFQYAATSFMRSAAGRGIMGSDEEVVTTLLSATG